MSDGRRATSDGDGHHGGTEAQRTNKENEEMKNDVRRLIGAATRWGSSLSPLCLCVSVVFLGDRA
jgi:hypothetical protein